MRGSIMSEMRSKGEDTFFSSINEEESQLQPQSSRQQSSNHVDVNNYPPLESFNLGESPLAFQVATNQLAQDIIIFKFSKRIAVYYLKAKIPEIHDDTLGSENQGLFDYVKLHELLVDDTDIVQGVSISSSVSLSFAEKRLLYAFSLYDSNFLYVVDLEGDIPEKITKTHWFDEINPKFNNEAPIAFLKFDLDQARFIACITEEPACNVWDTKTRLKITSFPLQEKGVAVCWHKAEPYKLMVAQRDGKMIFYNIIKQQAVQSVTICKSPLLCADWAPGNNCVIACASYSHAYIVDVAKPYSTHVKTFETHPNFTRKIKFSPLDYKMFATIGKSDSRIKVFQVNFQSILWSNYKPDIHDVEWLRARPYVLAIAGKHIYVFQSSILS